MDACIGIGLVFKLVIVHPILSISIRDTVGDADYKRIPRFKHGVIIIVLDNTRVVFNFRILLVGDGIVMYAQLRMAVS